MGLKPEQSKEFQELVERDDYSALDFWAEKINPKVVGMEKIKRALLLTVASEDDRYGDRGRCHTLLEGKPETAKSTLSRWIAQKVEIDYATHRTTKVGLTGDMSGDEITMGALAKADKSAIAIDELDKFKTKDWQGLLEAMSDGIVTLKGGGKDQDFLARCRVIAGCNRVDKFSPELLSRFDWHFRIEKPTKDKTKEIMDQRIDDFFRKKKDFDGHDLKNYLKWIKDFQPQMNNDVRHKFKALKDLFIEYVAGSETSPRSGEAIIRVAFSIAKLNHRDVNEKDILRAMIELGTSDKMGDEEGEYRYIEKFGKMLENGAFSEELTELIEEVLRDMLENGYITDNERETLRDVLD